jgi:hypothetical protein
MSFMISGGLVVTGSLLMSKATALLKWLTPTTIGSFQSDLAMNYTLACEFATSYTLVGGALPVGLSMSSAGVISGTPVTDQDGSFSIIVQATDGAQFLSQTFTMSVFSTVGFFDSARFDASIFA